MIFALILYLNNKKEKIVLYTLQRSHSEPNDRSKFFFSENMPLVLITYNKGDFKKGK